MVSSSLDTELIASTSLSQCCLHDQAILIFLALVHSPLLTMSNDIDPLLNLSTCADPLAVGYYLGEGPILGHFM